MIILILFAFVAGIVTILSPCILPILPIVLAGSVTGGKRRPYGVATGFILSFAFFTLLLSSIVKATGVSATTIRLLSIVVVAVFGLTLVISRMQVVFERLISKLSAIAPKQSVSDGGFWGGLVIGGSLGLVWTPCVGPILASVLTIAATATVGGESIIITLAYSFGTAIPLLLIIHGGRTLLQKNPWLLQNSAKIQKAFGVLMIVTAVSIFFNFDRRFQRYILTKFPNYGLGLTSFEKNKFVTNELEQLEKSSKENKKGVERMVDFLKSDLGSAPEFIVGGKWFNSKPLTVKELRGKVVLVDFWTYTCINCIRTLPYIEAWHEKYKDKGLVVVGVHTPEFEFEKDPKNVEAAIKDFGLTYPIMQDNNYATWEAYNNRYWPAKYLIDRDGKIYYTHFGEGAYDQTEKAIQTLLSQLGQDVSSSKINNPTYTVRAQTPESYLGAGRIQYFASPETIEPNKEMTFTIPGSIPKNTFAYGGMWTVGDEYAMPASGASLLLHFNAAGVYLVMRPKNKGGRIRVSFDGTVVENGAGEDVKSGVVTVTEDRLYRLIKLNDAGDHILKLEFLDGDVELFAFTFG